MINAIISLFGILILWTLWQILMKKYAVEKFRDELFWIRDELFDLAAKGQDFKFDSPLYQELEKIINGTIRFAHTIDYINFRVFNALLRFKRIEIQKNESKLRKRIEQLIENVENIELRNNIRDLKKRYDVQIIKYIIKKSLYLSAIVMISFFIFMIVEYFRNVEYFRKRRKDDAVFASRITGLKVGADSVFAAASSAGHEKVKIVEASKQTIKNMLSKTARDYELQAVLAPAA